MKVIPLYSAQTRANFIDRNDVSPWTVKIEGFDLSTSAIKAGVVVSLFGLAYSNELTQAGLIDCTDLIGPNPKIKTLYFKVNGRIVKIAIPNGDRIMKAVEKGHWRTFTHVFQRVIENHPVSVTTSVNVETTQFKTEITPGVEHAQFKYLGLILDADRINPNRQMRM